MTLKLPKLTFNEENPFKDDPFNRGKNAIILTNLIASLEEPSVIAVNGGWGEGKTVFLEKWRTDLVNNKGFHTLYFNAWENDFAEDALAALLGEMSEGINALKLDNTTKVEISKKWHSTKKIGSSIAKRSIPVALKILTIGALDLDSEIEKTLADFSEDTAENLVSKYEKSKEHFYAFKKELEKVVSELKKTTGMPVVFFIDELDRCRPTFAIEILEKAKHLFSVPGLVFVIAIDKKQLGHAIQSVYGDEFDVDGYLRRFFDFEYRLPQPVTASYAYYLADRFNLHEYFSNNIKSNVDEDVEEFVGTFGKLSEVFGLSLRTQEQCFSLLVIVLRTTPAHMPVFPLFLATMLALKAKNADLYHDYVRGYKGAGAVSSYISSFPFGNELFTDKYDAAFEGFILAGNLDPTSRNKLLGDHFEQANDASNPEAQPRSGRIFNVLEPIQRSNIDTDTIAEYIAKKIDILDDFISDETTK